ncbi:MAG TPA: hypothetical protein VLD19_20700, partial [Chitinophagaceae bacterium]|nr:hypothetical protein [Chitinophagaceae bacterium]
MKAYIINILAVLGIMALQSCDKNFDALNTNPDAVATVSTQYVFTKAQYDGAGGSRNGNPSILNFLMGTMQYTTSFN